MTTLWIGLGNSLRRDDGVGPRAAEILAAEGLRARAVFQPLPELALEIAAVQRVVFLDADLDDTPGVVRQRRVAPAADPEVGHRLDVPGLLALAARLARDGPEAWIVSIGILDVDAGEGFSTPVAAGFGAFLDCARHLAVAPSPSDAARTHHG